jgi:hypothetical protein
LKFRQTGYRQVYKPNGRVNFENLQGATGVYFIRENGRLVYIGYSGTNLYKTMLRHFERWNHRGQEVISYAGSRKAYKVKIIFLPPKKAAETERNMILRFKPRDNTQKLINYQEKPVRVKRDPDAKIRKNVPF